LLVGSHMGIPHSTAPAYARRQHHDAPGTDRSR
jgi:hypothetical protein